jgi:hypothetical protein
MHSAAIQTIGIALAWLVVPRGNPRKSDPKFLDMNAAKSIATMQQAEGKLPPRPSPTPELTRYPEPLRTIAQIFHPLIHEPFLRAAFETAERDGLSPLSGWVETPPSLDGGQVVAFDSETELARRSGPRRLALMSSRHFAAMRNSVAIGAQRTSIKPHQSSSIYYRSPKNKHRSRKGSMV